MSGKGGPPGGGAFSPGMNASNFSQVASIFCQNFEKLTGVWRLSRNRNMMMDFTKGIATEVRVLLAEIGKLRDERRQLQ